jgi:RIO-like serine/threonine protein kinase
VQPFESLSRDNIAQYVAGELGSPKWRDALVFVIEIDGARAVLKDTHGRHWLYRLTLGRRALRREHRIYKLLEGIDGIPRTYGMIDRDGLLIEYIDGTYISRKKVRSGEYVVPDDLFDRCSAVIDAMHERGVFHLDLRNRKNFLIGEGGEVHVIDFASSVCVPRWLPCRGAITRLLSCFDRAGVLKMKRLVVPERLTEDEAQFLTRFERWRTILFPPLLVSRWLRKRKRRKTRGDGQV